MSAKKPRFKPRVGYGWQYASNWCVGRKKQQGDTHRLKVTDARDLTPEKAVERVLQSVKDGNQDYPESWIQAHAWDAGMNAHIVAGKVRVRRAKQ